jgi:hypothetical protein
MNSFVMAMIVYWKRGQIGHFFFAPFAVEKKVLPQRAQRIRKVRKGYFYAVYSITKFDNVSKIAKSNR